ncbi:hypothetical protein E2R58_09290 [Paenibacillus amylolyticus]|nr:hypothetical protein E2R58_09290 [Paenibacillus amylolyticus]
MVRKLGGSIRYNNNNQKITVSLDNKILTTYAVTTCFDEVLVMDFLKMLVSTHFRSSKQSHFLIVDAEKMGLFLD